MTATVTAGLRFLLSAMPKSKTKKVNKITIYAPKHRLQEIERWRDEMNFSELFWSAFDREVAARSVSKSRRKDMQKVV